MQGARFANSYFMNKYGRVLTLHQSSESPSPVKHGLSRPLAGRERVAWLASQALATLGLEYLSIDNL